MLTGLWTIGIKVPDIEKELEFQKRIGNEIILDEKLELNNKFFRVPLIKMGDKYLHLAEEMVYEHLLDQPLPYGIAHLVYVSNSFDQDVEKFIAGGAVPIREPVRATAGFGERRVAFLRSPSGWIFEVIEIIKNLVPEVVANR